GCGSSPATTWPRRCSPGARDLGSPPVEWLWPGAGRWRCGPFRPRLGPRRPRTLGALTAPPRGDPPPGGRPVAAPPGRSGAAPMDRESPDQTPEIVAAADYVTGVIPLA